MLLDSNVLIDYMRGYPEARHFIRSISTRQDLSISVITQAEAMAGKECNLPEKAAEVDRFLSYFQQLDVNSTIAKKAAFFRRSYGIDLPDALIAATAFIHGLELATSDLKAFSKIKEIKVKKPY